MNPSTTESEREPSSVRTPDGHEAVARLTDGLVAGREEAYRELHGHYHDRMRRYLWVVCRGSEEAVEDALQETWVRVARYARRFDSEPDLWRWLAALARSAAVDGSRRRSRYGAVLTRYLGWLRSQPATPDDDDRAARRFDRLDSLLEEGLQSLSASDRALLVARYREGRTVRELAEEMHLGEKALESRLGRLRTHLRSKLIDRLSHEDDRSA